MSKITWNEENTARLVELAGEGSVSQGMLTSIAEEMGTTSRSIGAKLRRMGYEVDKAAPKTSSWTPEQEAALEQLVVSNSGSFTYAEIAAQFCNGEFSGKQVQGKLLSMELFGHVRKTDKKVAPRSFSPEEESLFVSLVQDGASMEQLAQAFNRPVASVRGKALSLLRSGDIPAMPVQELSQAKDKSDIFEDMDVAEMTVEQLVEATGKTIRGIKSTLSRRGLKCADYDGESKRAKLDNA